MNSVIAVFFASLISGALSLADFRPALTDMVQILTGVQITQQTTLEPHQVTDCSTDEKSEEQHCKGTAYDKGLIYSL